MKKFLIVLLVAVIAYAVVCMSGCELISCFFGSSNNQSSTADDDNGTSSNSSGSNSSGNNNSGNNNAKSLAAPKVSVYGNVITWNAVSKADSYEIYANGSSCGSTTLTHYVLDNLLYDSAVTVKAVSGSSKSIDSNKVSVDKNSGFSANETKTITLESNKEYSVASSIRCLKLSGKAMDCGFTIDANRINDLIVVLDNVEMTSGKNNNCFRTPTNEMDSSKVNFSVIFVVNGNNALTGYSQTEVPEPQTETNSGKTGTRGLDGRSSIVLPEIIIQGSGTLTLKGGKGGDGGQGAPSSGVGATFYGDGGDGGEGGSGIKCTTLVLAMEAGGKVVSTGSAGGKGGYHGVNGNITTGLLGSVTSSIHNGDNGIDGKPLVGKLIQFGGTFN